jgi:hypothetical protein
MAKFWWLLPSLIWWLHHANDFCILIICTFGFQCNVAADFVQCLMTLIFNIFYGSGDCQEFGLAPCKFYLITFSVNYYLNCWIWFFINISKNLRKYFKIF